MDPITDHTISLGDAIQAVVFILGVASAVVAAVYYGSRWTGRIEGGVENVRGEVHEVAHQTELLRSENNLAHERIIERMDNHPIHRSLGERMDVHARRIERLESDRRYKEKE